MKIMMASLHTAKKLVFHYNYARAGFPHLQLAADVVVTSSTIVQQQGHSPAKKKKAINASFYRKLLICLFKFIFNMWGYTVLCVDVNRFTALHPNAGHTYKSCTFRMKISALNR
jgi:hypothetical protein